MPSLLGDASYVLPNQRNTYTPTGTGGDYLKGLLSGFGGIIGDLSRASPLTPNVGPTSEGIGGLLGANIESDLFNAGLLGAPDVTDIGRIMGMGLLGVGRKGMWLWHGSANPNIRMFDPSRAGSVQTSDWGQGVYLSPYKSSAQHYAREAMERSADPEGDRLFNAIEDRAKEMGTTSMMRWIDMQSGKITKEQYDELSDLEQKWRDHLKSFREINKGSVYEVLANIENPKYYQYEGITDPTLAERAKAQGYDAVFIHHRPDEGQDIQDAIEEVLVMDPNKLRIMGVR